METTQEQKPIDRWHLHPDDIATRYAIVFARNNNYELGSQMYFDVQHEIQRRIETGIASGTLKLRTWPTCFVLPPGSTVTNTTLVDLQDLCDAAKDLGFACPKNASDLARTFDLPNTAPVSTSALAALNSSTDALPHSSSPDSASSTQERQRTILKKRVLIDELLHVWPSIQADMQDATRNGLNDAAKIDKHGCWHLEGARDWARMHGKLRNGHGTTSSPVWPPSSGRYTEQAD